MRMWRKERKVNRQVERNRSERCGYIEGGCGIKENARTGREGGILLREVGEKWMIIYFLC